MAHFQRLVRLSLTILVVSFSAFADAELDTVVQNLQARYDKVKTMSAKFEQSYKSVRFDEDKKAAGLLEIAKPGKMRWDYSLPKGKLMVSDGETISLYDPQDRQVIVNKQPKDRNLPAAIAFLSGQGKLKDSFHFEWIRKPTNKDQRAVLRATPKVKEPNVKEIHFTVSVTGEPMIVGTSILDELGGASQITFKDIKMNPNLSPKRFSFKAPAGITVVEPKM